MSDETACLVLALVAENTELRQQLAEAQEQCVELAVDAGELHAQLQALQDELARVRADREAWRAAARAGGRAVA
jgi:uncharacterized protein involved in exopolysaccharide biosynthesis